ncbi:MAG: DegT/DnrJ/EryC1/StrS aminotransferase [Candidatus Woesebacteria bacterium GW2011_GWB1_39_12]|uniref:DegT/DnrJ/EryC1/StrS aminotransferase n=2 Tax=Candidatus Woeseibacteriota TaxID=1752722 RepID=A0A0G0M9M1_9BACT|nr:MAG: DegT/DnrJ/EryC1/StrS aminotransferase [Candidatus Woesebacteria bacterium GW2011_GWA1_39_12]KKQ98328.1 MAG: DegT/DnrJ/EryC1/StrS aminotransferase [Candidatus Woesebacteria bacterium GW2011_GWB1_39_12]
MNFRLLDSPSQTEYHLIQCADMLERPRIPTQRSHFGEEEIDAIQAVLCSRWTGTGASTREFEEQVKNLVGAEHAVAVQSGTAAVHLALEACRELGIAQTGDEIIVPSQTFAASIQAIINSDLTPVFCDVCPNTLNLDPNCVAKSITSKTKIIMPVHYRGEACDMDSILSIASQNKLWVVEDAAHAMGSSYKGRPVGALGHITCFSFDHIKNITAIEGGLIATDIPEVANVVRSLANLGFKDLQVRGRGFRYHMPNLNAAIGLVQLGRFEEYKTKRREIASLYQQELAHIPNIKLLDINLNETTPFFYVTLIMGGQRDKLREFLAEKGIETLIRYDPNHTQPYFIEKYGYNPLPVTEETFSQLVVLPLFYEMTNEQQDYVIDSIKEFFTK